MGRMFCTKAIIHHSITPMLVLSSLPRLSLDGWACLWYDECVAAAPPVLAALAPYSAKGK